ncbi:hypothetical protein [Streptomyces sp. H27-D2]|uniref:hypothetical protein n=1 Tax=Streptomyces sp. H27-D2 TaxID=3046304 RepID=UPI002DB68D7B|nr:hypothetical protein [Streptomyces sp. H27-D2]MEC4019387.1 hypothetical protein [Streptomyces sp. H27-D2]
MSKQQRGKKHRTPQKRVSRPSVPRPRREAPALPGSMDLMARMLGHAKPEQIVELVLPYLWVALSDGRAPANICVDACLTLRNAYGQLGVRAELLPVTVAIRKKNGAGTLYGAGSCAVLPGDTRTTLRGGVQRQLHRRQAAFPGHSRPSVQICCFGGCRGLGSLRLWGSWRI